MPADVTRSPKAVVIGGSMAGLFAALLLRRAGWQVEVYERIGAEPGGRGAGIVTHSELFEVLDRAGIDTETAAVGVVVSGRRVLDLSGRIAGELGLRQVLTSWGHLYGLLKAGAPAGTLSPRQEPGRCHGVRRAGRGALLGRFGSFWRPADRHRRYILVRQRPAGPGCPAIVCRLRRLARSL